MISPVAAIITLLKNALDPSDFAGISPPPLPPDAEELYITVQLNSGSDPGESHDGPSGLERCFIQINCWGHDYEDTTQLRVSIKDYLLAYKGPIIVASVQLADVKAVHHHLDRDLFDGKTERYQSLVILRVWLES